MATAFDHQTGSHTRLNRKARRRAGKSHATAPAVSAPSPRGWPVGSGYGRYVGRVGALAVALGLGAAVATGYGVGGVGVAWAEDGETQSDTHDAPGDNPNVDGPPAGPQDESNINSNLPTGAPQPTGTDNPPSGPTNAPSVPKMQFDFSGGAHDSGDDDGKDDDQDGAGVSGSQGAVVTPPQPSAPPQTATPPPAPAADPLPPAPPAPPAGSNIVVPQTKPGPAGQVVPPTPAAPGGALPDPGNDTLTVLDDPGAGRSSLLDGGGGTPALTTFSALAADPDPQGPQLLMAAAAAAPGTPAPHPLVDQPDNLFDAVLGAPVVLANIAVTAVNALLTSILAPGPGVPAPPVMLFVVLGWVQRELQRTFFNQSPTAVVDIVGTSEDLDAHIAVLANDIDPDINTGPNAFPGDVLTVTDYTQPTLGSVVLNPNGTFTYTPDPILQGLDDGQVLSDSFTYTISDEASPWHIHGLGGLLFGGGHTSTTTVHIAIAGVNDAPVAVDDAFTVSENGPALTYDVVANDTDVDFFDTLTVTSVVNTAPAYGTVTFSGSSVTYTPSPTDPAVQGLDDGETLTDTFTYTVSDGDATDTATVTVTITGANDTPVAVDDVAATDEDTPATGDVLANDTDIDGGPLVVTTTTPMTGTYGTLTIDENGAYTYTPSDGIAVGSEGGEITLDDPAQVVSQGTATGPIVYWDEGDRSYVATTFTAGATQTYEFGQTTIPLDTVMHIYDGAFDPAAPELNRIAVNDDSGPGLAPQLFVDLTEGQVVTVVISTYYIDDPLDLPLSLYTSGPGVFAGSPIAADSLAEGQIVTDTFTYEVSDGNGGTNTATLTVTITGVNDAPVAVDDAFAVSEDGPAVTYDVVANDTDADGEPLNITMVVNTAPIYGNVTFAGGSITYTPDAMNPTVQGLDTGETLEDTFNYTVTDGDLTDTATVTVTITGANDAPLANPDAFDVPEDSTGTTYTVVTNDTDIDIETLTVSAVSPVTTNGYGTVTFAGGTVTYTPDPTNPTVNGLGAGDTLTDTFTYTVTDGNLTDTATVTITINGVDENVVLWDQPLTTSTWNQGWCSPCNGDLPAPNYDYRTFGSFSLGSAATLTSGRFAVYDVSPASDELNISIWDSPGGTLLHELTVTGAQYTKEPVDGLPFDAYWAVIDLPGWDLDAGNYYVSMFGTNGNELGWGSNSELGDDVQLTGNGTVLSANRYVGFQLSGDGA